MRTNIGVLVIVLSFCFLGFRAYDYISSKESNTQKNVSYEEEISSNGQWLKDRKVGDCFQYQKQFEAEHNFEITHVHKSHIYVVLAKDVKAALVAQPEPECKFPTHKSSSCDYWYRTVEYDSPFLIHGEEIVVDCPKELSVDAMRARLEDSSYKGQVTF